MRKVMLGLGALAPLMLPGCGKEPAPPAGTAASAVDVEKNASQPAPAGVIEGNEAARAQAKSAPVAAAPVLIPEAERGEKGARNLLLGFAHALELGRYGEAWAMLGDADRKRWSRDDFARMFADLPARSVAVPEGRMEGAAGSLYYTAPVVITGSDRDGRPVRFEGEAVVRRINDVDGASPAQLRWHFERLTLDWTH
jgi:hypothetical protein